MCRLLRNGIYLVCSTCISLLHKFGTCIPMVRALLTATVLTRTLQAPRDGQAAAERSNECLLTTQLKTHRVSLLPTMVHYDAAEKQISVLTLSGVLTQPRDTYLVKLPSRLPSLHQSSNFREEIAFEGSCRANCTIVCLTRGHHAIYVKITSSALRRASPEVKTVKRQKQKARRARQPRRGFHLCCDFHASHRLGAWSHKRPCLESLLSSD